MKTYAVLIPSWNAVIPKDWKLKVKTVANDQFEDVAGTTILCGQGDLMRIEPGEEPHAAQVWLEGALQQQFVREVTDADSL